MKLGSISKSLMPVMTSAMLYGGPDVATCKDDRSPLFYLSRISVAYWYSALWGCCEDSLAVTYHKNRDRTVLFSLSGRRVCDS